MTKDPKKRKVNWNNLELDPMEKEINDYLDSDESEILTWQEKLIAQLRQAAKNHNDNKRKMISIRTSKADLEQFKKASHKLGLPYQTVINILISMVGRGDLKFNEKKGKLVSK